MVIVTAAAGDRIGVCSLILDQLDAITRWKHGTQETWEHMYATQIRRSGVG